MIGSSWRRSSEGSCRFFKPLILANFRESWLGGLGRGEPQRWEVAKGERAWLVAGSFYADFRTRMDGGNLRKNSRSLSQVGKALTTE